MLFRSQADSIYLRAMYAAGARGNFDLLGAHAAGFKAPPETDPAVVATTPSLSNNDPSPVELRRAYAFRHVEDLRRIMVEQGDGDRKVAIMEMGWTSDPRAESPYRWHSVTEREKGEYLVRAFRLAGSSWPWASLMTAIYIADPHWNSRDEQFHWSITMPDGTPRPAYVDRKSTRLNSSHIQKSRMPSSA